MNLYDLNKADAFYKNYDPMIPVFTGAGCEQGHGIGNLFSGLFNAVLPILKKEL